MMPNRLVCVAIAIVVNHIAATAQDLQHRVVGQYHGLDIALSMPAHPAVLSMTAHQIAESVQSLVGVELIAEPRPAPDVRRKYRPTESVVMSGKTVPAAFNRLIDVAPEYRWYVGSAGVINLLPRQSEPNASAVLARRVPQFNLVNGTIKDALEAVHRIFDPDYTLKGTVSLGLTEGRSDFSGDARRRDQNKPITVRLGNVAVIDILNAVVAAHGAATWEVKYRDAPSIYQNAVVTIRGFAGWSLSANPRPRAR